MDDRFAVEEVIARGGSGVVYRALDKRLGRPVAIRLIAPELVTDARAVEQFLREAKALAKIAHPNVVEVFDIGDTPEGPYVVMEWIHGESLAARLRRAGRLSGNEVYALGRQLLGALSAAHGQSVVHGDIKPSNVLLQSPSMDVKLADFGIARDLHQGVLYATPERLRGDIGGPRGDVYALGTVLYSSVTGELEGSPNLNKVPSALRPVLARALERDPAKRYQSAAHMLADWEQIRALEIDIGGGTVDVAQVNLDPPSLRRGYLPILASVGLLAVLPLLLRFEMSQGALIGLYTVLGAVAAGSGISWSISVLRRESLHAKTRRR